MVKHADIWRGIDRLAAANGLSASALARRAGLDPTTFNPSKRANRDGKPRWPSTESLARILDATGASMAEFVRFVDDGGGAAAAVQTFPLIGLAQAGSQGFFDDAGYPTGGGWDEIAFPDVGDANAYALEIAGNSMEPVYRDGDVVVVSPNASVRRGDRVVVKSRAGEVMAKVLRRQSALRLELASFNPAFPDRVLPAEEVEWVARIVWASQ